MKRLVLLLGLVVLAVGVWMMVPRVDSHPVPVGLPGSTEAMQPEPGEALRGTDTAGEETVEATDAGFERSEVEAVEATAQGSRFFRVTVTNKETGTPVPGAIVSWYENFATNTLDPSELEEYRSISSDREKLTSRYGRDLVADDLGLVVIPVEQYVRTSGRHGELYGELTIRPDPEAEVVEEYELELERDLTLRVRVVDSTGEPAVGVRVGLLPLWDDGSRDQTLYQVGISQGPRGLLTVPHFQKRLTRWKREEPYPVSHLLRARIPGSTEGGVPLDGEDPPVDPVVLKLPPTGRVVLHARDKMGEPLPSQVVTSVYLASPSGELSGPNVVNFRPDQRWTGEARGDGGTVFDRVVTGKSFVASARVANEAIQEVFTGPVAERQEVHVALSPERELYMVSGRIVDEQRLPVVSSRFRLRYGVTSGGSGSRTVSTGDDGSFTTYVNVGGRAEEVTLNALSVEDQLSVTATEPARMFTMVGERLLVVGDNDLGDLALTLGPLVAAGRITLNGETPERRVNLRVQRLEIIQSRAITRDRWRSEQFTVRYPELGRFEIRGVAQPGRHRISVSGNTQLPVEPVEFAVGADDVLIELDSGGSLQAAVLVDEELPTTHLWLRLIPTDGQAPVEANASSMMVRNPQLQDRLYGRPSRQNGESRGFQWQSLWPGGYRLEILPRGARDPLLEIRDIHVTGGENEDPRLGGIDLRGKLRTISVRVVDAKGVPVSGDLGSLPAVLINDEAPDALLQGFSARQGSIEILTASPYLDLLVVCRGYKAKVVSVSTDTTVMLERFGEVLLRIVGGMPELPSGQQLFPQIYQKERPRDRRQLSYDYGGGSLDYWMQPDQGQQRLGADGELSIPVGDDGTYAVALYLINEAAGRMSTVEGIEPVEVEVRAALSPQVFQIRIPEEGLKKAIEQMDRQEEE